MVKSVELILTEMKRQEFFFIKKKVMNSKKNLSCNILFKNIIFNNSQIINLFALFLINKIFEFDDDNILKINKCLAAELFY